MDKVFIKTLGCKVNTYDSDALVQQFRTLGVEAVSEQSAATLTVVNTCSVTAKADKEARYLFRKFKRDNPNSKIIATGCYAQVDSAKISEMVDVDFIVPNEVKNDLASMVLNSIRHPERSQFSSNKLPIHSKAVRDNKQGHFKSSLQSFPKIDPSRTRAFLKIQDGCNGFCTYCLIPYARGASRSVSPAQVFDEVTRLVEEGIKEIVFTGIHIGDYGEDLGPGVGEKPFIKLVDKILAETGIERFRISSLEPREATQDLIDALARYEDKICDHFHLPLQSGDDRILKLMRRQYDRKTYAKSVERVRKAFPNAMVGADIIPGFPGETAEEHQNSVDFIRELDLDYLHVFPYSKRPNTAAIRMPGHLEPEVIKARVSELRKLSDEQLGKFYKKHIGREALVLWEKDKDSEGRSIGHTKNYLVVAGSRQSEFLPGQISRVQLRGLCGPHKLLASVQ